MLLISILGCSEQNQDQPAEKKPLPEKQAKRIADLEKQVADLEKRPSPPQPAPETKVTVSPKVDDPVERMKRRIFDFKKTYEALPESLTERRIVSVESYDIRKTVSVVSPLYADVNITRRLREKTNQRYHAGFALQDNSWILVSLTESWTQGMPEMAVDLTQPHIFAEYLREYFK